MKYPTVINATQAYLIRRKARRIQEVRNEEHRALVSKLCVDLKFSTNDELEPDLAFKELVNIDYSGFVCWIIRWKHTSDNPKNYVEQVDEHISKATIFNGHSMALSIRAMGKNNEELVFCIELLKL